MRVRCREHRISMDAVVRQEVQRGVRQAEQLEAELHALPVGSLLDVRTDLVDRILNIVGAFNSAISHLQSSSNKSNSSSYNSSSTTSGGSCFVSEEETTVQEQQPSPKKKRIRTAGTTTITTNVVSESFPDDDGHFWRKYGQKEILGSRYPRSYYRCRRKRDSGCPAIKYVQRSDGQPSVFHVTYRGEHTCSSRTEQQQQQQSPAMVNSACLRMNSEGVLQVGPWGPTLFHPRTKPTSTTTIEQSASEEQQQLSPFDLDFVLDNSTEVLSILEDACMFDHSSVNVV